MKQDKAGENPTRKCSGGRKRSPAQRDKDLQRTAELYLSGCNQYEIAEIIGVSQGTISNDLKAIRAMWRERAVIAFSERKAEELARLDKLEREYWQAWERSIKPAKSKSKKVKAFSDTLDPPRPQKRKKPETAIHRFWPAWSGASSSVWKSYITRT